MKRSSGWMQAAALACAGAVLAGCASRPTPPAPPTMTPSDARRFIARLLPPATTDRDGWATDVYAAFATLRLEPSASNVCAVVGVTEQESGFRADPAVPGLAAIAWKTIEQRAERAGVPMLLVRGALQLGSPNGKRYSERIDGARTERELSETFEDFIGMVPLGRQLFGSWNPVRTGGPMQVSIDFAERQAQATPYPYPLEDGDVRREVFTRRGGMYFGIAHLLDYPAGYDRPLYRFADFNAGRYASRNAALQNAITIASGIPLAIDGDLIRKTGDRERSPGATEVAARVLGDKLGLSDREIARDLERGDEADLNETRLYERVFALADRTEGRPVPRAVLPQIDLQGPKITRKLTTAWFANRVEERYQRCLGRARTVDRALTSP